MLRGLTAGSTRSLFGIDAPLLGFAAFDLHHGSKSGELDDLDFHFQTWEFQHFLGFRFVSDIARRPATPFTKIGLGLRASALLLDFKPRLTDRLQSYWDRANRRSQPPQQMEHLIERAGSRDTPYSRDA